MQAIRRKELLEKLEKMVEQKICMKVEGSILAEIVFEKISYKVQYDFLTLKDITNNNHIGFNLNQINFMGIEKQKVVFTLDDQKDTKIEIEMNY